MTEWMDAYATTESLNEKYGILREEITRLRGRREDIEFFDREAVAETIRELDELVAGDLIVFVANDFGRPVAYRPEGTPIASQNRIREAILERKYDDTHEDLNDIRESLLDAHDGIHKAIVAVTEDDVIRYHLPEGSNTTTNFITVREMVGLVDYTTNSDQKDALSRTY